MSDTPVSKIQIRDEFIELIEADRQREETRAAMLSRKPDDVSSLVRRVLSTPQEQADEYQDFRNAISEDIAEVMGGSGNIGPASDMAAIRRQANYFDRKRRANNLKRSGFARRAVFTATRRENHAKEDRGYISRVIARINDFIASGK